jgi:hypothetical protein
MNEQLETVRIELWTKQFRLMSIYLQQITALCFLLDEFVLSEIWILLVFAFTENVFNIRET